MTIKDASHVLDISYKQLRRKLDAMPELRAIFPNRGEGRWGGLPREDMRMSDNALDFMGYAIEIADSKRGEGNTERFVADAMSGVLRAMSGDGCIDRATIDMVAAMLLLREKYATLAGDTCYACAAT